MPVKEFVRPLLVELGAEGVEGALLRGQRPAGRADGIGKPVAGPPAEPTATFTRPAALIRRDLRLPRSVVKYRQPSLTMNQTGTVPGLPAGLQVVR